MAVTPKKEKFFFINKSEKSTYLSRSLPLEKAAAQRHVQSGRKRTRRTKSQPPKTADELSHRPRPTTTDSSSRHSEPRSENSTTGGADDSIPSAANNGNSESLQLPSNEPPDIASLELQKILCKQDPFDVTCIPLDKRVAGLLHYYMFYYHPSQWPNEMVLLKHGIYIFHDVVVNVMKSAIADELTMYCLLSAAVCRLQYVDHLPCPLVAGAESHLIGKAVQLLAAHIAKDDFQEYEQIRQLLVCIIFLNSAEGYRGDLTACKTHFNASVQLLKPRGGLKFLRDKTMRGTIAMGDLFIACVNLEPCLLDCSYDPGPASSLNLLRHELRTPCATSTSSVLLRRPHSFILPELEDLIEQLAESHAIKTSISTASMTPTRATQVTHWITLRNMAIRHKLLAIRTSDIRNHTLRIAIIMWSLYAMNITGRAKTVKIMAPRLKESLSSVSSMCWIGNEDVRSWILLIGAFCAADRSEASAWFTNECRSLRSCCTVSSSTGQDVPHLAEQLEAFQRNFFFDEDVQKAPTRTLAEKLRHVSGGLDSLSICW